MADTSPKGEQMNTTVNKVRMIEYVASGFTTGLVDLVLSVRKPDGTLITPAVTERGEGVYIASYTPDQVGVWQEKISSVINGDKVFRSVVIAAVDEDDIKSDVDSVSTKVDTATAKIDAVKTSVDAANTELGVIDGKVDTVNTNVLAVGTTVGVVNGKSDAIKTELDAVKATIDGMSTEVKSGGYFA